MIVVVVGVLGIGKLMIGEVLSMVFVIFFFDVDDYYL